MSLVNLESNQFDDTMSDNGVSRLYMRNSLSNLNTFFRFETQFLPGSMKELFAYCAHLFLSTDTINPALEKLAMYPITDFQYELRHADQIKEADRAKYIKLWKRLYEISLKGREKANIKALNYLVYGNSMSGIFRPFVRYCICPSCGFKERIANLMRFTRWRWDGSNMEFFGTCLNKNCPSLTQKEVKFELKDEELRDAEKINIILYYPGAFEFDHVQYSGVTDYYYLIPDGDILKIAQGSPAFLRTCPWEVFEAIKKSKRGRGSRRPRLLMREGSIYHMSRQSISLPGGEMPLGIPIVASVMRSVLYLNMMRRAQVALLMEHIVPYRYVYPGTDTTINTSMQLNLPTWKNQMQEEIKKWKNDPLYIMIAPIPLGQGQVGGTGKALMLYPEMEQVSLNIINGLNVPQEFVRGGLSYSGTSVSLRMLENQMLAQRNDLIREMQWELDQIAQITGLPEVDISMIKFRMADDIQLKQLYITLYQLGVISGKMLGDVFEFNYDSVSKERLDENKNMAIAEQRSQIMAAMKGQDIQQMAQTMMNPESYLSTPAYPPAEVDKVFQQIKTLPDVMQQQQAIQQIAQSDPTLGRQLNVKFEYDAQGLSETVTQMQGMDDAKREQFLAMVQTDQPNRYPILLSLHNQYAFSMASNPQNQIKSQKGPINMNPNPGKNPPRRQGAA